jgi:hypothetical protein
MVLNKETIVDRQCDATMYAGQIPIQKLLFVCAVICVPWMLLAKPIYIMRHRRKMNYSVSSFNIFRYLVLNTLLRRYLISKCKRLLVTVMLNNLYTTIRRNPLPATVAGTEMKKR